MTRFKTDPNAAEGIENIAPVADTRRQTEPSDHADLWNGMDADQRRAVLHEAGIDVDLHAWALLDQTHLTFDQFLYDVATDVKKVLKKMLRKS